MGESGARMLYEKALKEAAEIANKSVSDRFEESWRETTTEFGDFFENIDQGLAFENATDLDIIAVI
jgi:hypothetical protein